LPGAQDARLAGLVAVARIAVAARRAVRLTLAGLTRAALADFEPVARLPSLQVLPSGRVDPLQAPAWQLSPSCTRCRRCTRLPFGSAWPAVQTPAWQVSLPLQKVPSLQPVPFTACACWQP
jgi:hypothetical protein